MKNITLQRIYSYLKFLFLILLIIFLSLFIILPKTDCQSCKFEIENKSYNGDRFFEYYMDKCISIEEQAIEFEYYDSG
jgi:hypothetical protein